MENVETGKSEVLASVSYKDKVLNIFGEEVSQKLLVKPTQEDKSPSSDSLMNCAEPVKELDDGA